MVSKIDKPALKGSYYITTTGQVLCIGYNDMGDIIIDEDRRVMWDCWNDVVKYYNIVERFHCCSKCNSEYNRVTNRDNKLIAYCENCKHKVESETTEELINMWNSETV